MSQSPTAPKYIEIPGWVTAFALITCILGGALGFATLFIQIDPTQTVSWGGRTIGLAIVTGLAVYLKSPTLYLGAFAGGIARDMGDFLAEISKDEANTALMLGAIIFILLGIGGIIAANNSRRSEQYKTDD